MLKTLVSLRYVLLVAAAAAALGAVTMFWIGGAKIIDALAYVVLQREFKPGIASILSATDSFIFGIVLLVFATGITFGFVIELSPEGERQIPAWMRVHGIHDMKQKLVQIIILYLIVDFSTDWVDEGTPRDWLFLSKPIAILILAAATRLLEPAHRVDAPAHVDTDTAPGRTAPDRTTPGP